MTKKRLQVLLIEDSSEYAELVQRWLEPTSEFEFGLVWSDSLEVGLKRLAQGGVDAILLDLGLPDSEGMATFSAIQAHAAGVPMIILSGLETESLALQMVQQGAEDYIVKSTCNSGLLIKAIQYAVTRQSRANVPVNAGDRGAILGVMGAKGGAGATTFACNLAVELRRHTAQPTLLIDLDLSSGMVSFLMNTDSRHTVLDAIANIARFDKTFWEKLVVHGPGEVDLVLSPKALLFEHPDVWSIRHLLALVSTLYRWTIVDLGKVSPMTASLMETLTELCLVTEISVPTLYEAKRSIGILRESGLTDDRLRLVVNDRGAVQGFSSNELTRMFGHPIYAKLPEAAQDLHEACTQSKLLAPHSPYRAAVGHLARKLAGLPEEKNGRGSSPLRAFAGRWLGGPRKEERGAKAEALSRT
jgi:Flp pilus assembly CpaE family ATPase